MSLDIGKNLDSGEQRKAGLRVLALLGKAARMARGGLDKAERQELALDLLELAGAMLADAVD